MNTLEQIHEYFASLPEPKRHEMQEPHHLILGLLPGCRLWFLDGKDATG